MIQEITEAIEKGQWSPMAHKTLSLFKCQGAMPVSHQLINSNIAHLSHYRPYDNVDCKGLMLIFREPLDSKGKSCPIFN